MNVKKLSPVAEFLRANHAKAKNHNIYRSYPSGTPVKSCEFYDPNGKYLGKMSATVGKISKKPAFANLRTLIETVDGYKAGFKQLKESTIYFAKVLGADGKKESYLPEKMIKKQIVIDNQGYKTEDVFERTISSELKLIKKKDENAYGYVSQNVYQAEAPIEYQEIQTAHNKIKSDKF